MSAVSDGSCRLRACGAPPCSGRRFPVRSPPPGTPRVGACIRTRRPRPGPSFSSAACGQACRGVAKGRQALGGLPTTCEKERRRDDRARDHDGRNHGGRPEVIDEDMLSFAVALKKKGGPVPLVFRNSPPASSWWLSPCRQERTSPGSRHSWHRGRQRGGGTTRSDVAPTNGGTPELALYPVRRGLVPTMWCAGGRETRRSQGLARRRSGWRAADSSSREGVGREPGLHHQAPRPVTRPVGQAAPVPPRRVPTEPPRAGLRGVGTHVTMRGGGL